MFRVPVIRDPSLDREAGSVLLVECGREFRKSSPRFIFRRFQPRIIIDRDYRNFGNLAEHSLDWVVGFQLFNGLVSNTWRKLATRRVVESEAIRINEMR